MIRRGGVMVDFVVSHRGFWDLSRRPGEWARAREAEGWAGVGVPDHLNTGEGNLHPVAVLAEMSVATTRVKLMPLFANNLMRSPVEFAQISLSLQAMSDGRYEAALGSGYQFEEIAGAGLPFPEPAARARRFREAVLVLRELLKGSCSFAGEFYEVNLGPVGPAVPPPPLSVAVGGSWTIRHVAPLADVIELIPAARAIRAGALDPAALAAVTLDDLRAMVESVRAANPTALLSLGVFVAAGEGPGVDAMAARFGDNLFRGLAGEPARVAERLRVLAGEGFDRVTVLAPLTESVEALAPVLFEGCAE